MNAKPLGAVLIVATLLSSCGDSQSAGPSKSDFDIDREYRQDVEKCGDYPFMHERFDEKHACRDEVLRRYQKEYGKERFPDPDYL